MRVLIDTNIFIYREDDKNVSPDISTLMRILNQTHTDILLHPASLDDIKRDKNQKRKEIILSKVKAYPILQNATIPNEKDDFFTKIGEPKSVNDEIDNKILYSVYKNAVGFLITNDIKIHSKALKLNISDRVLYPDDAIGIFKKDLPSTGDIPKPIPLLKGYVSDLDLNDPIFDSLKKDYDFEIWFNKISKEGRECFYSKINDGKLGAIMIYKFEEEPIPSNPPYPSQKRLKIATLKVSKEGHKIGELLLKVAFNIAAENNLSEIYLTHFTEKEDKLVFLISHFGFKHAGILPENNNEDVYIKKLYPGADAYNKLTPLKISEDYYPSFYDGDKVRKFVIPIRPEYHNRLFTDFYIGGHRQATIAEIGGEFIVEGNTIKKAYLTNSGIQKLKKGDIILFYRSGDLKAITSLGIIDDVCYSLSDSEEIMKIIGKRSVYSKNEIESFRKPLTIILFRHHLNIKNPLNLSKLKKSGILKSHPQSIHQIDKEKYIKLKELGEINERFTVH